MFNFLSVLDSIAKVGSRLNDIVWSTPLVFILLAAGIWFTIRTRFVQIRQVKLMAKLLLAKGDDDAGVSSFQAFALSVAGRVGTGNIAGVATAIGFGGPGALFWMWAIATLGSATAYIESTLGQIYKEEIDGEYRGGPAYYFEKFTGYKGFGVVFAIITLISMGIFLPGVQSNSIATAVQPAFFSNASNVQTTQLLIGAFVAVVLALVIFGGTKRLASAAEVIVPVMSIAYMIIALIIIVVNIKMIPGMFTDIFKYAFNPYAGLGGVFGFAVMNGVKRGLYSNEAGQGTGPHAAAAASVNHPAEQGLVQAFSVYFDTLLVCTATGFMILITQSYNVFDADKNPVFTGDGMTTIVDGKETALEPGAVFTQSAVSEVLGDAIGPKFVAIALFFFAFTTLMAYYYMAESNIAYLTGKVDENGKEVSNPVLTLIIRVVFLAGVVMFAGMKVDAVWNFADVGVGIMAWYNVIGILLISILGGAPAIKALVDYEKQIKEGKSGNEFTFNPDKLNIKNVDRNVWK